MRGVLALALFMTQAGPPKHVDFGFWGTLVVPEGCTHVPRQGVDSAVGHLECGETHSRVLYDIGFASPGAKPEPRGMCTGFEGSPRPPLRVLEFQLDKGRSLFVCELPPFLDSPSRLVAVPSPTVSFHIVVKSPADASWLLTTALAFRPK